MYFWASWCGVCDADAESLVALQEDPEWQGVSFVGVATSDSRQDILESNKLEKKQFLNLIDSDGIVSTALGVDSLPATLLVDASGHVRYRVKGRLIGPSLMMLARELENISKETPND